MAIIGFNVVVNIITGRTEKYKRFDLYAKDGGFNDRSQPKGGFVVTSDRQIQNLSQYKKTVIDNSDSEADASNILSVNPNFHHTQYPTTVPGKVAILGPNAKANDPVFERRTGGGILPMSHMSNE